MIYFVFIAAFAILLSDGLPAPEWNLLGRLARSMGVAEYEATLTVALTTIASLSLAGVAYIARKRTLRANTGTDEGDMQVEDRHVQGGLLLNGTLLAGMLLCLLGTGWLDLLRYEWDLARWPAAAELAALAPFLLCLTLAWAIAYPAELAVREVTLAFFARRIGVVPRPWTLPYYLMYRIRHQIMIVVAPMTLVLVAKHFIVQYRQDLLIALPRMPWLPDALIGIAAGIVLIISPVMLRRLWLTHALEPGPLRDKLEQLCRRVGLRYREILVWESQGLMVNAAVMGLFAPLRYVLLSDGLLATMSPRQIEAVFGHEAGHVRRHHLLYFGLFSILSMLFVGGILELLVRQFNWGRGNEATLQLIALAGMMLFWWIAFGYVSRKFERQADLYGAASVTDGSVTCDARCMVHGESASPVAAGGVCVEAARLFGKTLIDVAHFNGIPVEANSWRHGSIKSRCDLLERFAREPQAVERFEGGVWLLKVVMLAATVIGCGVAAWLYWPF